MIEQLPEMPKDATIGAADEDDILSTSRNGLGARSTGTLMRMKEVNADEGAQDVEGTVVGSTTAGALMDLLAEFAADGQDVPHVLVASNGSGLPRKD